MGINKKELKKMLSIELARRDFFTFCNVMMPDFYKKDRQYLMDMCNEMQDFYESDDEVLVVNVPPRHRQKFNRNYAREVDFWY